MIQNPGFLPDHAQNWITGSLCHARHTLKISERSVHNFSSYLAHTHTNKQTKTGKNITSLAEVNIEAFEVQCHRRSMRISYVEHVTNAEVLRRVGQGQLKSRKLKYFKHVSRHDGLEKAIMLGIVPGNRRQGGQRKQWIDGIVHWGEKGLVEMVRQAKNRKGYRCLVHESPTLVYRAWQADDGRTEPPRPD